ncbi:MAG: hypothetical protein R8L58_02730 [Mariprofundaceae bacterium]
MTAFTVNPKTTMQSAAQVIGCAMERVDRILSLIIDCMGTDDLTAEQQESLLFSIMKDAESARMLAAHIERQCLKAGKGGAV